MTLPRPCGERDRSYEAAFSMWRRAWIALTVLVIDQASKHLAAMCLSDRPAIELAPFFELTLVYNPGAAFGLLSDAGGWQNGFFIAVGVAAAIAILLMLKRMAGKERRAEIALWLILGGALGNLANRLSLGHVVDFLHLYYASWHWPAFNPADSAIAVGAALLVLDAFGAQAKEPEKSE